MKVILRKEIDKLGAAGEVVTVKDGYARNYLFPRNLALKADKSAMKAMEEEIRLEELRKNKEKRRAEKIAEELAKVSITAKMKAGEEDKLFGSVTTQDIAEMLKEQGYDIDRRKIQLDEPIKALGAYKISIKIFADITAEVKLWVIKEEEAAAK